MPIRQSKLWVKTADAQNQRLARLKARRKSWLKVHLWLGLALGFFLSIFGVTGSILVFYEEINAAIDPQLFKVASAQAAFKPLKEIIDAANQQAPENARLNSVSYPKDGESAYLLFYAKPLAEGVERWQVFVDPYSAQVTGKRMIMRSDDWMPCCMIPFVFQLHYALLAGETGGIAVGIMAAVMVISVLTGLILWWPLNGKWLRVLTVKRQASTERFNHDLHQTSGFYTALILLAVLVSGVYMNLPKQFAGLIKVLSPETQDNFMDKPQSEKASGRTPIGLDKAFNIARQHYPEGRPSWLSPPKDEQGVYAVAAVDVPNLSRFWSKQEVLIDQYSGAIIEVRDPSRRHSAGETFLDWQWPLHSGKAFGWPGRIAVFISGLACPLMFVTGLIRWMQKQRAKQHKRHSIIKIASPVRDLPQSNVL